MKQASVAKKQWSIREYQKGDEKQILELRGIILGDSKSVEWWNWIFKDGPDGPVKLWVAATKNKIVGISPGLPLRIKIRDQVCKSSIGFDVMTHPDYQRQGILGALSAIGTEYKVKNGWSIDYGTSTPQRYPIYRRLKISNIVSGICQPPSLVKVINWSSVLKTRYRIPTFMGNLFGYTWDRIFDRKSSKENHDIEIVQVPSFHESINEFWKKASELKNIIIVRDMKYLNWRYVEKPGNEYVIFTAKRQNEIVGYIVLKVDKESSPRGFIVDLLAIPGEEVAAESLINKAIRYFQEKGAATISCLMLQDTPYYGILKKRGFISRKSGIQLNIRIFDQDLSKEFVTDPSNWYYTWGDSDTR